MGEKYVSFLFEEKVEGRMGRISEKRERRGGTETTGEKRKRGVSYHRRINTLCIVCR